MPETPSRVRPIDSTNFPVYLQSEAMDIRLTLGIAPPRALLTAAPAPFA